MRISTLALAFALLTCPDQLARAQNIGEKLDLKDEWVMAGSRRSDAVVVEIVSVPDDPGTNGDPPHVTVKVVRLLHGDVSIDRADAVWCATWPFGFGL